MFEKAIIVLGCGVDSAGSLSDDAKNSVLLAIEHLGVESNYCIIMTGFVSYKADFSPSISEAQAMKEFAIANNIPSDRIFVETESKDTLGNLYFTRLNLLMPLHITKVVIVRGPNQSDERINYLAQKVLGQDYTYDIIRPNQIRPTEQAREQRSLALAKEWLDPVSDGDIETIYKIMRERHPGYNSVIPLDSLATLL